MGSDHKWFVVTVDTVGIPRVVRGPFAVARACEKQAEEYYEEHSQEGELIQVLCEHDKLTQAALQHSVN